MIVLTANDEVKENKEQENLNKTKSLFSIKYIEKKVLLKKIGEIQST